MVLGKEAELLFCCWGLAKRPILSSLFEHLQIEEQTMKHKLTSSFGAFALVLGAALTQTGTAYAVAFTPPADGAPRGTTGGASRGSFFTPPADGAPRGTTGGASRGGFFTPAPDSAAPRGTTGGASRGDFFTPPSDSAAPRGTTGGASRGGFFTPAPDSAAPRRTTGGASRGEFFAPPPDSAAPRGTTGGASRSGNEESAEAMGTANGSSRSNTYGETAVVPISSETSMLAVMPDSFFGTTIEARPTILVYVPASNANEAVFSIKDEAKDLLYEMTLPVPASGGVVAVELPENAPELTVDQNYQWYLALKLDGELEPGSPFVDGWVKRISPDDELSALLGGSTLSEIEALGSDGIWYDTAAKLATLRLEQPNEEITQHWRELLESVGLAEIAAVPIVVGQ